jgi:hypothetical protein
LVGRSSILILASAVVVLALSSTCGLARHWGGRAAAHSGHAHFRHTHFGHLTRARSTQHAFVREARHATISPAKSRPTAFGFRPAVLARNGLPRRPFPGEAGFTGLPPRGETRFIPNEMLVHVGAGEQQRALSLAARLGITSIGSQRLASLDSAIFHFRLADGGSLNDIIRAFESEGIGIAQPNYVFALQNDAVAEHQRVPSDIPQYVVTKLRLTETHRVAVGTGVLVAVIDSPIDAAHPDLREAVINAQGRPGEHGTGMAGAIAAHGRLLGVAPQARLLAIRAFPANAHRLASTRDIISGIDRAISSGAKVINVSFAGPYDPALQIALKKAHDRGVVLITAAGNLGPTSPPLYPAADENVIAVTAVDQNDQLLPIANRGPHIALAAPGVDVLEATPRGRYAFDTGTSIAAAHVSGVAALILQRDPEMDVAALEAILFSTARHLGQSGRNSDFGFGLVDPYRALTAAAAKLAAKTTAAAPSKGLPAPGI